MDKLKVRAELLAKIETAWPRYKEDPRLVRLVELASNDDLRNHLSWAEMLRDAKRAGPRPTMELSPRHSTSDRELFRRVLSIHTNPHGGYTLARDECGDWYKGPGWVPFNLLSCAEFDGNNPLIAKSAKKLIETPGAEKLWSDIATRYSRNAITGEPERHADAIAASLAAVCAAALAGWSSIPRLTPSKFKEQREELARKAEQLALELERFYLPRDPDECELPGLLDFTELMSQEELDRLDQAIRITAFRIANRARKTAGIAGMDWDEYNDIGKKARDLGYQESDLLTPAREDAYGIYALMQLDHTNPNSDWGYGGVPTLPDLLRRIARKFEEDATNPPIKNPNLGNAERNFFARFLCKYFWKSFGDVSPAIVRDIVSMFYAQGITDGDVDQMIMKMKAAHPLPADP